MTEPNNKDITEYKIYLMLLKILEEKERAKKEKINL